MMERVGARDRPETGIPLSPLEIAFLDGVIRSFAKGISDLDVKKEVARGLAHQQDRFTQCTLLPKKQNEQMLKSPSWQLRRQMKYIPSKSTFYGASFKVSAYQAKKKRLLMRHLGIFPVVIRLII